MARFCTQKNQAPGISTDLDHLDAFPFLRIKYGLVDILAAVGASAIAQDLGKISTSSVAACCSRNIRMRDRSGSQRFVSLPMAKNRHRHGLATASCAKLDLWPPSISKILSTFTVT
jgi:hypothetical protein